MLRIGLNSNKSTKNYIKTEKITKKNTGNAYSTWKNIMNDFQVALEAFKEKNISTFTILEHSMIFFEMVSFTKRFSIVQNLTFWGYYHSALQELRFLIETTILAYYLDQQLPNTDYGEKIKLMQKHKGELWGDRLRRRTYIKERELGETVEKVINEINNSIDEYLSDNKANEWLMPSLPFKEEEFYECVRHSKNACALIIKHYLKCFTDFLYPGEMKVTLVEEDKIESHQV